MPSKTILFLCSGGGGNLRFVHQAIKNGWLPDWHHIAVITDRECSAKEYARLQKIPVSCLDFTADDQNLLLQHAISHAPDMIITTVHRILSPTFVTTFKGSMLNLHYSLLPSFAGGIGIRPVEAAMHYGNCLAGITVHEVTEQLDSGRPRVQIALPIAPNDEFADVMDLKFRAGCIALLVALRLANSNFTGEWHGNALTIKKRHALLNPSILLPEDLSEEAIWQSIK